MADLDHIIRELPPEFDEVAKRAMRASAALLLPEHGAFAQMSDEWLANEIRMLMRNDLWHEAFCTAGRDRIMRLSLEVERLQAVARPQTSTDQSVLEAALRDIALGAQMMLETPLPNAALKRYAAEVRRVADAAIKEAGL